LWAGADAVSKCRRLGLAGLPRDLPLEGLLNYARPAVTLAPPPFVLGLDACQSRTVHW
jgi:hypothetical protein